MWESIFQRTWQYDWIRFAILSWSSATIIVYISTFSSTFHAVGVYACTTWNIYFDTRVPAVKGLIPLQHKRINESFDIAKRAFHWSHRSKKDVDIQYIPRNMHTVLLCFALLWLCNHSQWIHMKYLSIFIRVALLALGQSLDCHSASEVSLMDKGKSVNV